MPKEIIHCDDCEEPGAKLNIYFDKNLCFQCKIKPEYKMIYKTTAKNNYYLTEKDIANLQCFEIKRPTGYSKNKKATLIREVDAVDYFCVKHNIEPEDLADTLEELTGKKEIKTDKIMKGKEIKRNTRRHDLKKALKKAGLELRPDSKLCEGYINGSIKDYTIEEVVNRMCEMKFLYDYARMDHYKRKAIKAQREEFEAGYIPDVPVSDHAEMLALKKIGGFPKKWPWLKKK